MDAEITSMIIRVVVFVAVFTAAVYLMIKEKSNVLDGQISDETLSRKYKVIIWILCFFNPVLAGAVFYYGWRKKLPVKAKQANRISVWAFLILFIVGVSLGFLFYFVEKEKIPQVYLDSYNKISQSVLVLEDNEITLVGDLYKNTQTDNIDHNIELSNKALLEQDETLLKAKALVSEIDALKKGVVIISNDDIRNDALNLSILLEKINNENIKLIGINKKIIRMAVVYYENIKNGKKADVSSETDDMIAQATSVYNELDSLRDQNDSARAEFIKKAKLTELAN